MPEHQSLVLLDKAKAQIAIVETVSEVKDIRDKAEALRVYHKQVGEGLEIQNRCAEIKIRAERRAGEILMSMEKATGGQPYQSQDGTGSQSTPTLADIGVTRNQSSNWQSIAKIEEEAFEDKFDEIREAEREITSVEFVRAAKVAHVGHNSGDNEWFTPENYAEAARRAMGRIDLDPASTEEANKVIRASRFFDAEIDGLSQPWKGRVWMNPPYAQPLIEHFITKMADKYKDGEVKEACVLVNNATETGWFQEIADASSAICFPCGRVKFWHPEKKSAPLQGQAVLYLGKNVDRFREAFHVFGFVCTTS